jgi:hypothetical protein
MFTESRKGINNDRIARQRIQNRDRTVKEIKFLFDLPRRRLNPDDHPVKRRYNQAFSKIYVLNHPSKWQRKTLWLGKVMNEIVLKELSFRRFPLETASSLE